MLADALVPDCPVVGVSDSFAKMSGFDDNLFMSEDRMFLYFAALLVFVWKVLYGSLFIIGVKE